MAWQCSAHLCSCSVKLSLYASVQRAFSLSSVILTTSIDPRVSLMATERAGSASLPFPLFCSPSLPPPVHIDCTVPRPGLPSIQALQHTFVTDPAKRMFKRWGKARLCTSGGFACVLAGDSPSMASLWGKMCLCRAAQPPSSLPSPFSH